MICFGLGLVFMKIREIEIKDADAFSKMQYELDKETKFMMFEPGERKKDLKRMELWIQRIKEKSDLLLIAENNGEIIGFIMAQRGMNHRIQHRAYIVVGVRTKFQGRGIGTKFFEKLNQWALKQQLRRLELTVMITNVGAKKLYEKSGFVMEGIKKDSMYVEGEYIDEYYMAKIF